MYNYTVTFTGGDSELAQVGPQLLTDEEITDCRLRILPSMLQSNLSSFEPGVVITVTIGLLGGATETGSTRIPGGMWLNYVMVDCCTFYDFMCACADVSPGA